MSKWIKKYWYIWVGLLIIVIGGLFYFFTGDTPPPPPVVQEITDRAITRIDNLDRKLEGIQREVDKTRHEVIIREKKISIETKDMDCIALAHRWNAITDNVRKRRVSSDATSNDRRIRSMGNEE